MESDILPVRSHVLTHFYQLSLLFTQPEVKSKFLFFYKRFFEQHPPKQFAKNPRNFGKLFLIVKGLFAFSNYCSKSNLSNDEFNQDMNNFYVDIQKAIVLGNE